MPISGHDTGSSRPKAEDTEFCQIGRMQQGPLPHHCPPPSIYLSIYLLSICLSIYVSGDFFFDWFICLYIYKCIHIYIYVDIDSSPTNLSARGRDQFSSSPAVTGSALQLRPLPKFPLHLCSCLRIPSNSCGFWIVVT